MVHIRDLKKKQVRDLVKLPGVAAATGPGKTAKTTESYSDVKCHNCGLKVGVLTWISGRKWVCRECSTD